MINKRFRTQTKDLWQHTHTHLTPRTQSISWEMLRPVSEFVCSLFISIAAFCLASVLNMRSYKIIRDDGPSIISSWWCADTYHRSHLIQRVMCRVPFWDESLSFETLFSDWWPQCSINRQLICAGSSDPQAACYHFSASACSRWPYKVFILFSLNVEIVTIHS